MAKLTKEKITDYINSINIDEQLEVYELVKEEVSKNLSTHQQQLEEKANQYQQISDRINNLQ